MQIAIFTWNNSGQQRLFVNGAEVDTDLTTALDPRNGGDFGLGAIIGGGSNPFNGRIAELQIYDSDETANAGTIATTLRNKYFSNLVLDNAKLTVTGGQFVVTDTLSSTSNTGGTFQVLLDGNAVPAGNIAVRQPGEH